MERRCEGLLWALVQNCFYHIVTSLRLMKLTVVLTIRLNRLLTARKTNATSLSNLSVVVLISAVGKILCHKMAVLATDNSPPFCVGNRQQSYTACII